MIALQGTLLDLDSEPKPLPLDDALDRMALSNGAWIELRRQWITGADALFAKLVDVVPWLVERRFMYDRMVDVPRLVRFYSEADQLPDSTLDVMREELSERYSDALGEPFATTGMCLYRDGRDSVAWHGDTIGRASTTDTVVAIVSIGAPRALLLRPRGGGPSLRFELGCGDLFVMGGTCQRTWEHAVPKTTRPVGPRISIQFRPHGVR
jgi:alkylated DNA repair dioxygenase AlkB